MFRDRIERNLNKIKSFVHRKRQEFEQSGDNLLRRSTDMKNFLRDVDLETAYLSEVNEFITTLIDRKYDPQIIRLLEKKREDVLHDLQR